MLLHRKTSIALWIPRVRPTSAWAVGTATVYDLEVMECAPHARGRLEPTQRSENHLFPLS